MTFSILAEYFEELEQTSSRLSLISILAALFKEARKDEIKEISYLIQGRVAPFYEATEIGMAEKNVASAIARSYEVDREEVLKLYGKLGDMGLVAQHLSLKFKISNPPAGRAGLKLGVKDVFDTLRQIAKTTGKGTVEKKISLLCSLLEKVDGVGAKHLSRIPLGTNRLGVGDPTVLDAFAEAKLGDRKKRKLLEDAYNKVSDLGLIGETLWEKGLEGVQKLDVTVGRPIRSQLAERINDPEAILEKYGGEAHVQLKWDGFRTQLHKKGQTVRIFSRNLEETTHMFPELIEGVLKQVKANSVILDAEAIAYNPESEEFLPFQETTKRRRKYQVEEMAKELPLKAFVFDVMFVDGKSLMDTSLRERMKVLEEIVKADEILIPQPGEFVKTTERLNVLFQDALTKGLEGVLVKRPDSLYEAGARNFNWIKLKKHSNGELKDTIDCVILGYIFGRGKRAEFGAGALLVGVYDKETDEFVTV